MLVTGTVIGEEEVFIYELYAVELENEYDSEITLPNHLTAVFSTHAQHKYLFE